MALVDIFNPRVSVVVKGVQGKVIVIYGTNGTGKTRNMVKAPKPLVLAVENGLNALNGVPYITIDKWVTFKDVVKQLTSPATSAAAHEKYSTIIIDALNGLDTLGAAFVSASFGVKRLRDGNDGYGLWQEYSQELETQIKLLTDSGYTVVFLAHEGEQELLDLEGNEYTRLSPKGDKRLVEPIMEIADIVGYAQPQSDDNNGNPVNSTLYLKGNRSFRAKSRFDYIVRSIPEWTYDKLEKAIEQAITLEEKATGMNSVTFEEASKEEEALKQEKEKEKLPLQTLVGRIGLMLKKMQATEGSLESYKNIMQATLGNTIFKCNSATEEQRDQVELLYNALIEKGYNKGE